MTDPRISVPAALAFGEAFMALLDQGKFTATYKHAVLLALLDLCLENTGAGGEAPPMFTTRQLADKVVALYWPHTSQYASGDGEGVLRQGGNRPTGQAEIVKEIHGYRAAFTPVSFPSVARARLQSPHTFQRLVDKVEFTLIRWPLPRVQFVGKEDKRFIYDIGWSRRDTEDSAFRADVRAYLRGGDCRFDNRIMLRPGVGSHLVVLTGLLRPLVHQHWTTKVAKLNKLEEAHLGDFLFDPQRHIPDSVRSPLRDLQEDRCFYCNERFGSAKNKLPQVDHFMPWARHPDDGLDNYVLAHGDCNRAKSDFIASAQHLEPWVARSVEGGPLDAIDDGATWERDRERTMSVARAIYLRLQPESNLWVRGDEFVSPDLGRVHAVMGR